jgi:hypothetical protein
LIIEIVTGLVVCVGGLLLARKLFSSDNASEPAEESNTVDVETSTAKVEPAVVTIDTVDEEVEVVVLSMKNKKAELLAAAKEMGVDVTASMTKAAILEALSSSDDSNA